MKEVGADRGRLTRLTRELTDHEAVLVNLLDDALLEVIHLERDQTLIQTDDLDVVLDEVDRVFRTLDELFDLVRSILVLNSRLLQQMIALVSIFFCRHHSSSGVTSISSSLPFRSC